MQGIRNNYSSSRVATGMYSPRLDSLRKRSEDIRRVAFAENGSHRSNRTNVSYQGDRRKNITDNSHNPSNHGQKGQAGQKNIRPSDTSGKRSRQYNSAPKKGKIKKQPQGRIQTPQEMMKLRQMRKIRLRIVLFVLAAVIMTAALIAIYETQFIVDTVVLNGLTKYKTDEVERVTNAVVGKKLYSFKASELNSEVTFNFPYIKNITVDRKMPRTVVIEVTEEKASYYTTFGDEIFLLNDTLKVLARTDSAPQGVIKLKLPDIKRAIAGRAVEFSNEQSGVYVKEFLSQVQSSPIFARINMIDLRNKFDIDATCDGKYLLELGNMSDVDIKLKNAVAILKDMLFASGNKATVKLSDIYESSVIIDNQLTLD